MRGIILAAIGIFVLVTPGVLTCVLIWSILVPKHRKLILNQIKVWKGDTNG